MGLTDLKKELQNLTKDELIFLISDLYKKNQSVQEYLDFYVTPNEDHLFKKYQEKILLAFYPKRGWDLKLKDAKQAISEFKKLSPSPQLIASLMFFYVECGVKYTNDYGDISESFYNSIESVYAKALAYAKKENLLDQFKNRALAIVKDTQNVGWGFPDILDDTYSQFYSDDN